MKVLVGRKPFIKFGLVIPNLTADWSLFLTLSLCWGGQRSGSALAPQEQELVQCLAKGHVGKAARCSVRHLFSHRMRHLALRCFVLPSLWIWRLSPSPPWPLSRGSGNSSVSPESAGHVARPLLRSQIEEQEQQRQRVRFPDASNAQKHRKWGRFTLQINMNVLICRKKLYWMNVIFGNIDNQLILLGDDTHFKSSAIVFGVFMNVCSNIPPKNVHHGHHDCTSV